MKKILAILMAGVLTATAFAGCGGGGESSNTNSGSSSKSGESSATGVNASTVDYAYFGNEDNVKLKVWAPDAAVNLVKQQIEDFKKTYSEKKFDITVIAQGESDAEIGRASCRERV